ncbi:DEAD/DEAH box helicase domain-containing protein [Ditylenchus destructor]|uniref:ATP-dependent RNA helicase n=1 Tax=Ditylenchus destructor TaxID=166010 RepID=A0AAD4R4C4_9BILA|nr:DEAD/DEAH box helicase domain-containing protein [Ditylenchus destructor]
MTAFEEMGVLPELGQAVTEMEWSLPTDIQSEAIPAILGGGDVLMAAETGSGKTGAFCLPIIQIVYESMCDMQKGKNPRRAGGQDGGWKINIFDRDPNLNVDGSGLLCESTHPKAWSGGRATKGVTGKGKYYYEAKIENDGLCRMGFSTPDAALNLGTDPLGFGFGGTGKKSNAGQFEDYGESFTLHDVIGCFLDLDNNAVHFSKNGKEFPTAFKIRPQFVKSTFFPAVVIKNARLRLNFGEEPFKFLPKNGFMAIINAPSDCVRDSDQNANATEQRQTKRAQNAPMCVILEPTKELAQQTDDQIQRFKKFLDTPKIRNMLAVGGIAMNEQMRQLQDGVDIITCTPGRIMDMVKNKAIVLEHVRFFVLDEADSLVSNHDSVRVIQELHQAIPKYSPSGERLQMIVCSATLHNNEVKRLADQYMHYPQWVDLKGSDVVPETVHQVVCMVDPKEDMSWIRLRSKAGEAIRTDGIHASDDIRPGSNNPETLSEAVKILKASYVLKAIEEHKMKQCIIFCRTKLDCDNLENFLTAKGYSCLCLHGDRNATERSKNLERFKKGEISFLICTDVAARGLDVRGVPYVINVTLPPAEEKANYVHRIGRVGRAERMGLAISLVSKVPEKVWYHQCKSRGANCDNTKLVNQHGCAKWYNEPSYLAEIEEHLGVTIAHVATDMSVPVDEYEGKVMYGSKRANQAALQLGHAVELTGAVQELNALERSVQLSYLRMIKPI